MTYDCQLIDREPEPTLVILTRTSVQTLPHVLGKAWGDIMKHAAGIGAQPS